MERRLDAFMAEKGLVKSRTLAQELIKDGKIKVNGFIAMKSNQLVSDEDTIEIFGDLPRYVSRGGQKLEKAISVFNLNINDLVCLDIGSSTGGFTDCLLQNGAIKVFSVDVGTEQLDEKLMNDLRVVSLEKLDIRSANKEHINDEIDFICTDVSFISLKFILPEIKRFLKKDRYAVALIKPQFEAGKKYLNKKGVVKDKKIHSQVVDEMKEFSLKLGLSVVGVCDSPIYGGDGNKEFLICLRG